MAATFLGESRLRFFIHEDMAYVQVYAGVRFSRLRDNAVDIKNSKFMINLGLYKWDVGIL